MNNICNDTLSPKEVAALSADLSKDNEYITETAGFIPLEVKMRQFEQNGIIAQFQVSDFDSNDYRDIYLNPDFSITPEDDMEDIQDKLAARNEYISQLKKSKEAAPGGVSAESTDKNEKLEKEEEEEKQ